jgi:hypothetical protein
VRVDVIADRWDIRLTVRRAHAKNPPLRDRACVPLPNGSVPRGLRSPRDTGCLGSSARSICAPPSESGERRSEPGAGEGRERDKARGVRFGRPKKLSAHQLREAIDRIAAGEAVAEVARTFGVDHAIVYRLRP